MPGPTLLPILVITLAVFSSRVRSAPPLTTCGCTPDAALRWSVPASGALPAPIASIQDPTQCWQLNKTANGVVCDGVCVLLGPCSSPLTPTWSLNSSTSRLTVAYPAAHAGWCLDENTAGLYVQAYPQCFAGDTHQLWTVDSDSRVHEMWTGTNLCVGSPGSPTSCPAPPPPPGVDFCYRYHSIHAPGVYDPSGPLLAPDGLWHVWEDDGGWTHYVSTDLLRWRELGPSTGFGGLTGSVAVTPSAIVAFWPEAAQGGIDAAVSTDHANFTAWRPLGRVITAPAMAGSNFRDPLRAFSWAGDWYVGVGCNNQSRSADLCLFRAANASLTSFAFAGVMFSTDTTYGQMNSDVVWVNTSVQATMLECPDVYELGSMNGAAAWMLVGSLYSTNQWWVGSVEPTGDGVPLFSPDAVGILDYGNMYAGKTGTTFSALPTDRRVLFGFTGWHEPSADQVCGRALTIPRDVTLGPDRRTPRFTPIPELQSLRNSTTELVVKLAGGSVTAPLSAVLTGGAQVYVCLVCALPTPLPVAGSVFVRTLGAAAGTAQYTEVGYNFSAAALYVDHTACCATPNTIVQHAPAPASTLNGLLNLTVLVDGGVIESFLNGLVTITALVSPDERAGAAADRSTTLGITAAGVDCTSTSWQMLSIAPAQRRGERRRKGGAALASTLAVKAPAPRALHTAEPEPLPAAQGARVLSRPALSAVVARSHSLLRSPGALAPASLYIAPVAYNHTLLGPAFAAASGGSERPPPSFYYATQWTSPRPVTNMTAVPGPQPGRCNPPPGASVDWQLDNGASRICAMSMPAEPGRGGGGADGSTAAVTFELAADGTGATDGAPPVPCGDEFDAFLSPTDGSYSNVPARNLLTFEDGTPALGDMASLSVSFSARLVQWAVTPRCGPQGSCGPSGKLDYGYATLGIVLSNPFPSSTSATHSPPQTLFYQAILADTRSASPSCSVNDPCTTAFSSWFFDTLPTLGVSDAARTLGIPCLTSPTSPRGGLAQDYAPNLLPRLSLLLAEGQARYGADGNLSHWYVSGLYVGVGEEGSVVAAVQVGGLDVAYTLSSGV